MCQKWEGDCGLWVLNQIIFKKYAESLKKIVGAVWSCLLNSTANSAHFHPSLAGLAVLFCRQLPNGSHDFFQTLSIFFLDYLIKNPQTTIALPFLTYNTSTIGGVKRPSFIFPRVESSGIESSCSLSLDFFF